MTESKEDIPNENTICDLKTIKESVGTSRIVEPDSLKAIGGVGLDPLLDPDVDRMAGEGGWDRREQ